MKLYDWFESKTKFSLVFEIAKGGELFNRICEQGKLTEADAVETMRATLVRCIGALLVSKLSVSICVCTGRC